MEPFDALALATVEDRPGVIDRTYYAIAPAALYEASIAHLRAALADGRPPRRMVIVDDEEIDNALRPIFDEARGIPPHAWDLALAPADGLDPADREQRRRALDVARRWFTEWLHQQLDYAPLGLHITKDERFRE